MEVKTKESLEISYSAGTTIILLMSDKYSKKKEIVFSLRRNPGFTLTGCYGKFRSL